MFHQVQATALRVETQGGVVKIGPVLSYFEAAWLAGLVPGATLSRQLTAMVNQA